MRTGLGLDLANAKRGGVATERGVIVRRRWRPRQRGGVGFGRSAIVRREWRSRKRGGVAVGMNFGIRFRVAYVGAREWWCGLLCGAFFRAGLGGGVAAAYLGFESGKHVGEFLFVVSLRIGWDGFGDGVKCGFKDHVREFVLAYDVGDLANDGGWEMFADVAKIGFGIADKHGS